MKTIRTLLALFMALCMLFALCACGAAAPAEDAAEEPVTEAPAKEEVSGIEAGTYHFEYLDEYGDTSRFSVKLRADDSFTVMTSVGSLGDNVCNGTGWTDNGDGTFTTGATDTVLDLPFIGADGTITWTLLDADGTVVPVGYEEPTEFLEKPASDEPEEIIPGVYKYTESGLAPFDTYWTLYLNPDGSYLLTEENEHIGLVEYPGESCTIDGSTVICGPMGEAQPVMFTWSDPAGFTVTTGTSTFAPAGVELKEEPADAVVMSTDKVFQYTESGLAPFDTYWTLTLHEDGSYVLTEENERAGVCDYPGESWTMDGDTVTCGPMGEAQPFLFTWSDPAGFAVTVDGSGFTPVQ